MIEHTSGSIEDKPETGECVGALRRSVGCFNQQSLLGRPTQNVSQQSSNQLSSQLKVNPRKVNAVQKSQRRATKIKSTQLQLQSTFWPRFLCQCVRPPKIEVYTNFQPLWTMRWPSQRWSNLRGNPSCSKCVLLSHVWTETASKELVLNQKRRWCVRMRWVKKSSNFDFIYINHWGCVTQFLGV